MLIKPKFPLVRGLSKVDIESAADLKNGKDYWMVKEDVMYEYRGKSFVVPHGYITDGASVPRMFWTFAPSMDPDYLAAAIGHDYLYQHQIYGSDSNARAWADAFFKSAMKHLGGMSGWRINLMYMAVRVGGGGPWKRSTAPI